ncbi:Hypothetical protein LUCI_1407 [Lucifera butyrica]|uniref:Uncharacterized protein n=1 Tax=Lucifera butyrica TaxID=1351585 RepID=A0A498R440_9FIRM|nr:Hypothetical protein LUCI_1407 [Lucifera butyrica]
MRLCLEIIRKVILSDPSLLKKRVNPTFRSPLLLFSECETWDLSLLRLRVLTQRTPEYASFECSPRLVSTSF